MPARRDHSERLAELETKRRQLDARISALSARDEAQRRKDDDRRKLLLGSIVLADLRGNVTLANYIRNRLPDIMRDGDQRLFVDLLKDNAL